MHLSPEQREIGKLNFLTALGRVRGDFLRQSLSARSIGSLYFGYEASGSEPVRVGIVGTGNEGCGAMIGQSPPDSLRFVAFHDIRPSQVARARKIIEKAYGKEEGAKVKHYDKWQDMLADKQIEAIVIATPLWTHAKLAIEAMQAGKHVLCEKLMARSIKDAKAMVSAAKQYDKVLSIGHQRHYSTLYDSALAIIRAGMLGEIRHIRCLWHRNNTFLEPILDPKTGQKVGEQLRDSWSPEIPEEDRLAAQSGQLDLKEHGYRSLEELVRWRLYDRTGGGLMAELGSHQLDACSLFLGKVHPIRVAGVGGKYFFTDDRECEDHVYCTYEMPGNVVITYSSINTNALEGYGEIVTGTKGTLMILNESDVLLFKEREPGDEALAQDMRVTLTEDRRLLAAGPALSEEAALAKMALERASFFQPIAGRPGVNRGYREEMEAFACSVRHREQKVRCDGQVALGDTVMALTANIAMRSQQPIQFQPDWYDPDSQAVPDAATGALVRS